MSAAEESEQEVGVWDDDGDGNLIALFALDEIPVAVSSTLTINCTQYRYLPMLDNQ